MLINWETDVLAAAAVSGTLLRQAAFQAGDLAASLPVLTVGESLVAVAIGITVRQSQIRSSGAEWLLISVVVTAMITATPHWPTRQRGSSPPARPSGCV